MSNSRSRSPHPQFSNQREVLTSAKFYAQRLLGIRKNIVFASASSATRQEIAIDDHTLSLPGSLASEVSNAASNTGYLRTEFRSFRESAISDGWYMLEVSGTLQTIGSNVSVRGLLPGRDEEVWADLAQVQLGSHQQTKRLIRLVSDVEEVCLHIDGKVDFKSAPSLTLVRVTASFAKDRMTKKLRYNSSQTGRHSVLDERNDNIGDGELPSLYRSYQRIMERHVRPIDYSDWLARRDLSRAKEFSTSRLNDQFPNDDVVENEATIELSASDLLLTTGGASSTQTAGKASGLLGNPSLSVFLTGSATVDIQLGSVCNALNQLSEKFQCQLKVIVPAGFNKQVLQDLSLAYPSIIEVVYFDLNADCSAIDAFFMEHLSDLQVFICDQTLLQPDCLLRFYSAIRANTGVGMIYSDSDCMDEFGRRVNPVFKPEWNPELLMNGNYIGSVVMIARHVLTATGGWRHRFEDSAMYDLLLRAGEYLVSSAVLRIPDVLWCARIVDSQADTFITNGTRGPQVLYEFLQNARESRENSTNELLNFDVTDGQLSSALKINKVLVEPLPRVEILIPSKDKVDLLESCINSILRRTTYAAYQITVIDNGSEELETLEYYAELERHPTVKLLQQPGEFNYSALNNFAVTQSDADVVVLLNNDTEVIASDWLNEMVSHAIRPDVGCVGAKLYYSNNRVQHGGVIVGLKGMAGHAHRFLPRESDGYCGRLKQSQDVTAVTAACLAVRRAVYQKVGGLNETDLKVAYNDVDFCLRVYEAGYRNIWTPYAELYHHESISRGSDDTPQKRRRFQAEFDYMRRRWATDSWEDSAYNPNLAKDVEDFSLSA